MKLRGRGIGAGSVLGTAAMVRTRNGIALMPSVPQHLAEQIAARKLTEKPDIVLVAENYDTALAIADTIEWGSVIGIAASSAGSAVPAFGLPSVVDIADLLSRVPEEALLLLDAERGFVSINPDISEIAQYQAEKENINPRKRYFLDDSHQSAVTLDGRTVQIIQQISHESEVSEAVGEGADGVFCDLDLVQPLAESDDVLPISVTLGNIVHELAGKPVFLDDDLNLPYEALLFAATRGEMIAAERLQTVDDLAEFQRELHETERRLIENDDPARSPLFAILFDEDVFADEEIADKIEAFADSGVSRIVCDARNVPFPDVLAGLESLNTTAAVVSLPLYVLCHPRMVAEYDFDPDYAKTKMLEWLVGCGVAGIMIDGDIQEYKTLIRQLRYESCRAEVLSLLSPPQ